MGVRGRLDERMMAWDETIAENTLRVHNDYAERSLSLMREWVSSSGHIPQ